MKEKSEPGNTIVLYYKKSDNSLHNVYEQKEEEKITKNNKRLLA